MKKYIPILFLGLILPLLTSCFKAKNFEIKARFDGLGSRSVLITYSVNNTAVSQWVPAEDGYFSFIGESDELTVISIAIDSGSPLVMLAMQNGDEVQMRGFISDPRSFQIKGPKKCEQWLEFLKENQNYIDEGQSKQLDEAIEKYIDENPNNVVSTLLLMFNYSDLTDKKKVASLLNKINDDAKPENLLRTYYSTLFSTSESAQTEDKIMRSFNLPKSGGSWDFFFANSSSYSVIWFWDFNTPDQESTIEQLKTIGENSKYKFAVADVFMEGDSLLWKNRLKINTGEWDHFWAPGGITNPSLQDFKIKTPPSFVLVDSMGKNIYSGNSLTELKNQINKLK